MLNTITRRLMVHSMSKLHFTWRQLWTANLIQMMSRSALLCIKWLTPNFHWEKYSWPQHATKLGFNKLVIEQKLARSLWGLTYTSCALGKGLWSFVQINSRHSKNLYFAAEALVLGIKLPGILAWETSDDNQYVKLFSFLFTFKVILHSWES